MLRTWIFSLKPLLPFLHLIPETLWFPKIISTQPTTGEQHRYIGFFRTKNNIPNVDLFVDSLNCIINKLLFDSSILFCFFFLNLYTACPWRVEIYSE